jgi:hypothetical protein
LKDSRWRTSGKAADRGNAMHAHAQALALGAPAPPPVPGSEQHVEQFQRFLDAFKPKYLAAEAPVYNLGYSYAGTLDAIVELDGQVCVLDYKTTDHGPEARSRPPYDTVALQLCAYARAERMGTGPSRISEVRRRRYYTWADDMPYVEMPKVQGALALMVSPVDYQLHAVRIDDAVWNTFLYAREVARWVLDLSKTVIGPPLAPPASQEQAVLEEAQAMVAEGILSGTVGEDGLSWDEWMRSLPATPTGPVQRPLKGTE